MTLAVLAERKNFLIKLIINEGFTLPMNIQPIVNNHIVLKMLFNFIIKSDFKI